MKRICILSLLICLAMVAMAAPELKLAGIKLGMKPTTVKQVLGKPTMIILAQPEIGSGAGTGAEILLFNSGLSKGKEVQLSGMDDKSIPNWMQQIMVNTLSLDQQEWMYHVNDLYSVGVTITGKGAEAEVTDIVAYSFGPLWQAGYPPSKMSPGTMFYSSQQKRAFPAITASGISIGSKLIDVYKRYGWTNYFYPFNAQKEAALAFTGKPPHAVSQSRNDTDGRQAYLVSLSQDAEMIYPSSHVAFTLINSTVVRIQIGNGVVKPPAPAPKQTNP